MLKLIIDLVRIFLGIDRTGSEDDLPQWAQDALTEEPDDYSSPLPPTKD